MTQGGFSYRFDARGHCRHVRRRPHSDLIEQVVLFTHPGEWVMRRISGAGLLQLVFSPNSGAGCHHPDAGAELALQRWLNEWILVESVQVEAGIQRCGDGAIRDQTDRRPRRQDLRAGEGA